ncbi:MAG: hypothetical protein JSU00_13120 [Acidobacteria bacterium]|nr:hypothetical protein [Acidobacteriota bacterium]
MIKLISVLALSAAFASAATFTGVISDSMCVKDHKSMNMGPDADCIKGCVKAGAKYVLLDGAKVYKLSDQQTPEKFAAQKVRITGTLFEKTGVIKVERIEAVK